MTLSENTSATPVEIRTPRLKLRSWQADDAEALLPILEANWNHLSPWIPARVATPAPLPILAERLADYAVHFKNNREWRYVILRTHDQRLLGEIALFPRSATGRVALPEADRAELGYWLREDENGHGFVTEAATAVLAAANAIPHFSHVEIHCDARNLRSVAVPRRLGFSLLASDGDGIEVFYRRRDGLVRQRPE